MITLLLRRFWFVPVIAALMAGVAFQSARLSAAKASASLERERAAQLSAALHKMEADLAREREARVRFAETTAQRERIVERYTREVKEYANTPDGSSLCLPAERVSGIKRDRDELFAAPAGGAAAVPPKGPAE